MPKPPLRPWFARAFILTVWAANCGAIAATLAPGSQNTLDGLRLALAFAVGCCVQSLVMITSGRGWQRLETAKTAWRGHSQNVGEIVLTGFASAATVGALLSFAHWEISLAGSFTIGSIAGSVGYELVFGELKTLALNVVKRDEKQTEKVRDA